jgi:hypothetical protein
MHCDTILYSTDKLHTGLIIVCDIDQYIDLMEHAQMRLLQFVTKYNIRHDHLLLLQFYHG